MRFKAQKSRTQKPRRWRKKLSLALALALLAARLCPDNAVVKGDVNNALVQNQKQVQEDEQCQAHTQRWPRTQGPASCAQRCRSHRREAMEVTVCTVLSELNKAKVQWQWNSCQAPAGK